MVPFFGDAPFLYEPEASIKEVTLSVKYGGIELPMKRSVLKFKRPEVVSYLVGNPCPQTDIGIYKKSWQIGFFTPLYITPRVTNQTGIQYAFAALQTFKNTHNRILNNGNQEYAYTLPQDKLWLDRGKESGFPYGEVDSVEASIENYQLSDEVFHDRPMVQLNDELAEIATVTASASYWTYLMTKPTATSEIPFDESIWCPIKVFPWRWGGQATIETDGSWASGPSPLYFVKPTAQKVEDFPNWVADDVVAWKGSNL